MSFRIIVISSIKYPSESHEFGKYESRTLVWSSDLHEIKWHPLKVKNFVPGQQGKIDLLQNVIDHFEERFPVKDLEPFSVFHLQRQVG